MAIQLGSAYGKIIIDSSGAKKGVKDAKQSVDTFSKTLGGGIPKLRDVIAQLQDRSITITVTTIERWMRAAETGAKWKEYKDKGGVSGTSFGEQTEVKAAGGPVLKGQKIRWNEPGYQGELMVMGANGYVLNRKDAMQAVGALNGAGEKKVYIPITQIFNDRGAAAIGMAEIRRLQNDRLDKTM